MNESRNNKGALIPPKELLTVSQFRETLEKNFTIGITSFEEFQDVIEKIMQSTALRIEIQLSDNHVEMYGAAFLIPLIEKIRE